MAGRRDRQAYTLLLSKGLLRIGLGVPDSAEFRIVSVHDPYGCNTNPDTGLTGPKSGIVSVYRRPLPAANLGFLSAVMWDGREADLASQATDATLGHAQANTAPTPAQVQQIVAFESGLFTAQIFDNAAKELDADHASGGPAPLKDVLAAYVAGVNDPFNGGPFTSSIFHLYDSWAGPKNGNGTPANRAAVARGEQLFDTVPITITNTPGINDALGKPTFAGFCATCHDTPSVGNHSLKAPLDIGIADAGDKTPPVLDTADLPVFTLACETGPLAGQTYVVTDPGRALISGKGADIGKFKGPILRGLAGRAPYFHNGSAASLMDVVNFYNQRFGLNLTDQNKSDLVAFLQTL